MHFLLPVSLCFAATAIADDLFSNDAALDASSLFWDDYDEFDTIGNLGVSDSSLPIANLESSAQDISSCLGESSDLFSWSKVRAREVGKNAPAQINLFLSRTLSLIGPTIWAEDSKRCLDFHQREKREKKTKRTR